VNEVVSFHIDANVLRPDSHRCYDEASVFAGRGRGSMLAPFHNLQ